MNGWLLYVLKSSKGTKDTKISQEMAFFTSSGAVYVLYGKSRPLSHRSYCAFAFPLRDFKWNISKFVFFLQLYHWMGLVGKFVGFSHSSFDIYLKFNGRKWISCHFFFTVLILERRHHKPIRNVLSLIGHSCSWLAANKEVQQLIGCLTCTFLIWKSSASFLGEVSCLILESAVTTVRLFCTLFSKFYKFYWKWNSLPAYSVVGSYT